MNKNMEIMHDVTIALIPSNQTTCGRFQQRGRKALRPQEYRVGANDFFEDPRT